MKTYIKILILIVVAGVFCTTDALASLSSSIDKLLAQPSQKNKKFSIKVLNADSGKTLYSRNANMPLIPASNMKLIVTAAALKYLGPDFQYKTQVGIIDGDLVIIGSGDPLLADLKTDSRYQRKPGWVFDEITAALKKEGISSIDDIIVDSSVFDDQRVHPNWPKDQLNKWYAAEVAGLNYNDNCIDMTVKNNNGKAVVFFEPRTDFVRIVNQVKIVNAKGAVGAYRTSKPNTLVVRGRCKTQQGPFPVAIERPPAFFGFILSEKLQENQIRVTGNLKESGVTFKPRKFKRLTQFSTPLSDCLARSNKNSLQIAAEALLKTIGARSNPDGKNGSWQNGSHVISQYIMDLGIEQEQFFIDDGCGLSRANRLSADCITRVLLNIYKGKDWTLYRDSLAIGGVDGTLRKYFHQKQYKGRIFGKTGYIRGVRTFSGVCTTDNGSYIFSILSNNNHISRKIINDIAKAIMDEG